MDVRNILVLRGGALGDFVVTLPALAALRRTFPDAQIELAGNANAAALAVNRGLVTRTHSQHEARWRSLFNTEPLPKPMREWLSTFDVVINYWPDDDGSIASHFPLRTGQQYLSTPAAPGRAPAAAHYAAILQSLGIETAEYFCRIEPRHVAEWSRAVGSPAQNRPIAIHPGSGSRRKNWPADRWLEMVARIATPVLLIAGDAEATDWSRERLAHTPVAEKLAQGSISLATQLPLEALVDALSGCRTFLGHDSGVSHLAAACGVPCILLFGPTDPALWAPPASHVRVIRSGNDLSAITVDDVLGSIGQTIADQS